MLFGFEEKLNAPQSMHNRDPASAKHDKFVKLSEARQTTPDILISDMVESENCPDIVQCLHINVAHRYDFNCTYKPSKFENNNYYSEHGSISYIEYRDKNQSEEEEYFRVQTIPTNVKGDFKQKIESELRLLDNGLEYIDNQYTIAENKPKRNILTFKLIPDAELSGGIEYLTKDSLRKLLQKDVFNTTSSIKKTQLLNIFTNVENIQSVKADEKDQGKINQGQDKRSKLYSSSKKLLQIDHISPKIYKKSSFDDRQLPLVGIEYKCPTIKTRKSDKFIYTQKQINIPPKLSRISNAFKNNRTKDVEEIYKYQNLLSSNKDVIINGSKYSKMSIWAKYLKNSAMNINADELITSQGNKKLIDIYDTEITIPIHEKYKRNNTRFEFDKIRKSLAFEAGRDDFCMDNNNEADWITVANGKNLPFFLTRDTPLNEKKLNSCGSGSYLLVNGIKQQMPIFSSMISKLHYKTHTDENKNIADSLSHQHMECLSSNEESELFTKQAQFQIEGRTPLSQAKDTGNFRLQVIKKKRCSSPITSLVRDSLKRVGIQMPYEKRRVSRQILTEINISKLQIIVNDLQSHIEVLNNLLLRNLTIRDDLQMDQNSMIIDIEDLTNKK